MVYKNYVVPDSKYILYELQNGPLTFVEEDGPCIVRIMLNTFVHWADKCAGFGC